MVIKMFCFVFLKMWKRRDDGGDNISSWAKGHFPEISLTLW
jgi:hypothetical protein